MELYELWECALVRIYPTGMGVASFLGTKSFLFKALDFHVIYRFLYRLSNYRYGDVKMHYSYHHIEWHIFYDTSFQG